MIRFKDKIIEGYKICPMTGKIFNEVTGEVESTTYYKGRCRWKSKPIYCLMGHTYLGYFKGCCIHHIDYNKQNDILLNLQFLTRGEHMALHNREAAGDNHWNKGKIFSKEHRLRLGISHKGLIPKNKGKKMPKEVGNKISIAVKGNLWWCKEGEQPVLSKICPGEGWERGRFKYIDNPNKGLHRSEETKLKIKIAQINSKNVGNTGMICYNNGIINKMFKTNPRRRMDTWTFKINR